MVESINPHLDKSWMWTETKQRPMVHYTSKDGTVYAICLAWPGKVLELEQPAVTPRTEVRMLGYSELLEWEPTEKGLAIQVPEMKVGDMCCHHAWTFKLTGLKTTQGL